MAKYFVADSTPIGPISASSVSTGTGNCSFVVSAGAVASFKVGDAIKYFDNTTKATLFGVVYDITGTTISAGYDDRIYTDAIQPTGVITVYRESYLPSIGVTANAVDSYFIAEELSQAFYSSSYIRYNVEKRYILNVDNHKRAYLKDFGVVIGWDRSASPLLLVDDCGYNFGVAYSIAAEERTTEFINNVFKQRVEFRIATK